MDSAQVTFYVNHSGFCFYRGLSVYIHLHYWCVLLWVYICLAFSWLNSFGDATASLKNWHLTFHVCKDLLALPFWGRNSKPKKLTHDNPWLQALVNTSVLGALQQAWKTDIWLEALSTLPFWGRYCKPEKLTYHVPWLQELVDASVLGALQQGGRFLNLLDFFAFLKSRKVIRACWFHSRVSVYVVSWLLVL